MGLLKTAAKVAVASHVHGTVKRRQSQRWAAQDAAASPVPAAPQPGLPAAATQPVAPPSPAPGTDDMLAQLTKLGELRTAGVLTDAEFETQKARILG